MPNLWIFLVRGCVVPASHWNNYQVRQTVCYNPQMLDLLLSASDESFILLILVNYASRWKAEVAVSTFNIDTVGLTHLLTMLL